MARILVLRSKIPFQDSQASRTVRELLRELRALGHEADTIELPDSPDIQARDRQVTDPQAISASGYALWRSFDVSSVGGVPVDIVISTSAAIPEVAHPRNVRGSPTGSRDLKELLGG